MYKLLKTNQFLVEGSYGQLWVRLRRTQAPWASITEVSDVFSQVMATLRRLDHAKMALLIDLREAPLNSDPAFERSVKQHIRSMPPFKKMALLVKTAVGKAQIARINRDAGLGSIVFFFEEAEAIAYLDKP